MRIKILLSGKTSPAYIRDGCDLYEKRLKHYIPFEIKYLTEIKSNRSLTPLQLKEAESQVFFKAIKQPDFLILLDEKGKQFTSGEFSGFIGSQINSSRTELTFAIGGAFGFDDKIKKRAQLLLSLSQLTFPHQLARLLFLEQLYRAFTIIKNEPYHHI